MKLVINFIDGDTLEINDSTVVNGYVADHRTNQEFDLKKVFSNSFNASHTTEASMVATAIPQIGYASLIHEVDWISIGQEPEFATLYKTSSIKSISRKLL